MSAPRGRSVAIRAARREPRGRHRVGTVSAPPLRAATDRVVSEQAVPGAVPDEAHPRTAFAERASYGAARSAVRALAAMLASRNSAFTAPKPSITTNMYCGTRSASAMTVMTNA